MFISRNLSFHALLLLDLDHRLVLHVFLVIQLFNLFENVIINFLESCVDKHVTNCKEDEEQPLDIVFHENWEESKSIRATTTKMICNVLEFTENVEHTIEKKD
tara:strand:- start:215 stop:523 length:309 start_codon:yes stop_codon:yes gene_type:complete